MIDKFSKKICLFYQHNKKPRSCHHTTGVFIFANTIIFASTIIGLTQDNPYSLLDRHHKKWLGLVD